MPDLLDHLAAPGCHRIGSNLDRCGAHFVEPMNARYAGCSGGGRRSPRSGREEVIALPLTLPSCAPINRDHAREHERKSEFCFEVGNESRNPPGRGHVPIKCWRVACTQVAKKPNRKSGCVNRPADALGICHPTPRRSSSAVATSQEDHHSPGINETLT